jgi:hypothetical protein
MSPDSETIEKINRALADRVKNNDFRCIGIEIPDYIDAIFMSRTRYMKQCQNENEWFESSIYLRDLCSGIIVMVE